MDHQQTTEKCGCKEKLMINKLREWYIDDLSKMVCYGGNSRPRVAHPGKWRRYEPIITIKDTQIVMTPENIKKTYVWSDQHFFHSKVIEFANRPFVDVNDMNNTLIDNYNNTVGHDGIGIWVGDVGFTSNKNINELLDRCHGYKILVIGNHDYNGKKLRNLNFDETHLIYQLSTPSTDLVFTHYPMDNIELPWVNIHGHLHTVPKLETGNLLHYNVNCEAHNFTPQPLTHLLSMAIQRTTAAM